MLALTKLPWCLRASLQHDNPNVELDVVLAVLSGGPVGIGDGINLTNISLAKMSADRGGRILRPGKPLTAMDATFIPPTPSAATVMERRSGLVGFLPPMAGAHGCAAPAPAGAPFPVQCTPAAEQSHTSVPLAPSYAAELLPPAMGLVGEMEGRSVVTASWRLLVSLHLGDFTPTQASLLLHCTALPPRPQ